MRNTLRAGWALVLASLLTGCAATREPGPGEKGFSTVHYLMNHSAVGLGDMCLVSTSGAGKVLPFDSSKHWGYIEKYCAGGNDCPQNEFESDCAHFQAHALAAGGVNVSVPSAACQTGKAIRVKDLAIAFDNASLRYTNVWKFSDWRLAQRGDFCFLAKARGSGDHMMFLAQKPTSDEGAFVYGHTNHRTGTYVEFDLESCVFYRIIKTTGGSVSTDGLNSAASNHLIVR